MVVSGGKVLGFETRFNENLVMFFLRNRRGERYASDWRALKPGPPHYERIAAEAVARYRAEVEESEEETLRSIDEFLEGMRQRRLANEAFLAEQAAADEAAERARAEATARRPSAGEADEDGEPDEQIN